MKPPRPYLSTFSVAMTLTLLIPGCSDKRHAHEDAANMQSWTRTLSELKANMKELEENRNEAQSFIETAEVHQVTRTKEEKVRQLWNLRQYKADVELKIDSLKRLITIYEDSIHAQ